ncbi:ribokinase [Pseudalkalibacillus caeni]|uniref:Ribokinase n=1 Tax=Exobacillus caeni TaxID=2574798 RepID=A0A5R9F3D6_9BACL|nr:ribokinase [Pseudalkalibacillus caeni]TLS36098.1 ribokinase [Pseudalkalibacillus caeni]
MEKRRITVIGSINMDLVTSTERIPELGETVSGTSFTTKAGGKGANQAVAAANLNADVTFVGCVGDDAFGHQLLKNLQDKRINTDYIKVVPETETGIAAITIANKDNSIIVVPGANLHVTPELVERHEKVIAESDIILLQLEIPLRAVERAIEIANNHGVKVILNPAPVQKLQKKLYEKIDYITPNEHESIVLLDEMDTEKESLTTKIVITRGKQGASIFEKGKQVLIEGFTTEVIDTTGAGDAFNGALAVAISEGKPLKEACRFANAVAAISVTRLGAQSGMPGLEEVKAFLKNVNHI